MKKISKILFIIFMFLFSIGFSSRVLASGVTWNPDDKGTGITLSNNNLTASYSNYVGSNIRSTEYKTSGKFYCELKIESINSLSCLNVGVANSTFGINDYIYTAGNNVCVSRFVCSLVNNDIIGLALDMDNKSLSVYKNNTLVETKNFAFSKANIVFGDDNRGASAKITANFGTQPFSNNTISNGYLPYDSSGVLVSSVTLNKNTDTIVVNNSDNLVATITPDNATNKNVTWKSSDESIATVDQTGKVTAVKEGTATITATTTDASNLSATCTVNITKSVVVATGITLNKSTNELTVGNTDQLSATITPSNVTTTGATWTSSDPTIATVDQTGNVTAIKAGTATITATTADGSNLSATCTVTVTSQSTSPTDNSGNAVLTITMTNGNVKSYTVSMTKVNDFISWYNNRSSGSTGNPYYTFDKSDSSQTTFSKKTEYVVFDKISSFETDDYAK